jgi:hypothetical protein
VVVPVAPIFLFVHHPSVINARSTNAVSKCSTARNQIVRAEERATKHISAGKYMLVSLFRNVPVVTSKLYTQNFYLIFKDMLTVEYKTKS